MLCRISLTARVSLGRPVTKMSSISYSYVYLTLGSGALFLVPGAILTRGSGVSCKVTNLAAECAYASTKTTVRVDQKFIALL